MDTYGMSMIAILVGDNGSLQHCTCRWNHANGANDNMMTTEQISKFFGVNFYETFKPKSVEDIWQTFLASKIKDDEFCEKFGCIKIEQKDEDAWDDSTVIRYKKIIDDEIVTLVRINDDIACINGKFVTMQNGMLVDAAPTYINDEAFY